MTKTCRSIELCDQWGLGPCHLAHVLDRRASNDGFLKNKPHLRPLRDRQLTGSATILTVVSASLTSNTTPPTLISGLAALAAVCGLQALQDEVGAAACVVLAALSAGLAHLGRKGRGGRRDDQMALIGVTVISVLGLVLAVSGSCMYVVYVLTGRLL